MNATPLAERLAARIRAEGPLPLETVMAEASAAYYGRGDVFGRAGDFTTAPEISQIFGELIGLWCAVTWQAMGSPCPFTLLECGPGRGTLMADLLRAAGRVPGFTAAAAVHLVERSAALREIQRRTLNDRAVTWHDDLDSVPEGPLLVVANEFLDALPIRQFVRTAEGWHERYVGLDTAGALILVDKPATPPPMTPETAAVGAVVEHAPAVAATVATLAQRLVRDGGAALIVDYGYLGPATGDTLQAVKAHRFHPVLAELGAADLTAHVDFDFVARGARAEGARVFGPEAQGTWLARLGLAVRVAQLTRGKPAAEAAGIAAAARRLSTPEGMGLLFKVIGLAHPSLAHLDGFAQDAPA